MKLVNCERVVNYGACHGFQFISGASTLEPRPRAVHAAHLRTVGLLSLLLLLLLLLWNQRSALVLLPDASELKLEANSVKCIRSKTSGRAVPMIKAHNATQHSAMQRSRTQTAKSRKAQKLASGGTANFRLAQNYSHPADGGRPVVINARRHLLDCRYRGALHTSPHGLLAPLGSPQAAL